jgi:hypothetical protein
MPGSMKNCQLQRQKTPPPVWRYHGTIPTPHPHPLPQQVLLRGIAELAHVSPYLPYCETSKRKSTGEAEERVFRSGHQHLAIITSGYDRAPSPDWFDGSIVWKNSVKTIDGFAS